MEHYTFWFVAGSQFLYGEETLKQVEKNVQSMVDYFNSSGNLPYPVVYKGTVKTADGAQDLVREANYDRRCAGIMTFCHTFSPSKMWIVALADLQKPWLHLHTKFFDEIPNDAIDMDYNEPAPECARRSRTRIHRGAHAQGPGKSWSGIGRTKTCSRPSVH